jgi:hypothetical protein
LFPRAHMGPGFSFWYKKASNASAMPKKKVFVARNLDDCLLNLQLRTGKSKKKIKIILSQQFCAYLNYEAVKVGAGV